MARGADTLGERYAKANDIRVEYYPADWNMYGKSARGIFEMNKWLKTLMLWLLSGMVNPKVQRT